MSATEEFRRVVAKGTNDVGGMKDDDIVSNGSAVPRDIAGAMTCADDLRIAYHATKSDEIEPGHGMNLAMFGEIVNSVKDALLHHGVGNERAIEIIGRVAWTISN